MADGNALSLAGIGAQYERAYGKATLDDLRALAAGYLKKRSESLLDAAMLGLAFDSVFSAPTIDLDLVTEDMRMAWELAYPNVPLESLAGRSIEQLEGAINGWKGKLFEVEVERRLNAGEWVGDLHLKPGQTVEIADKANQPDWDIKILDENGRVDDLLQLKATDSVSYIREALDRYPDTPIISTSEVADRLAGHHSVASADISNSDLTEQVSDPLANAATDHSDIVLAGMTPVTVIFAAEAWKVLTDRASIDQALTSGGNRAAKGAVAAGFGAAAALIGGPILGVGVTFLARLWLETQGSAQKLDDNPAVPLDPVHMYETASGLQKTTSAVRAHYECPPQRSTHAAGGRFTPQQELLELVDFPTRLEIERGSMPLDRWIDEILKKNVLSMSKRQLDLHLRELHSIQDNKWVQKTHASRGGFFEALKNGWKDGGLSGRLNNRITLVNALWKEADGQPLTQFQIMLMWSERQEAKKHSILKCIRPLRAERTYRQG